MTDEYDVIVVGAGLVGLATAMSILERQPDLQIGVLEKEARVAVHQSGHNSGVVHSGLYYAPGSLKARLCQEGRRALVDFAERHQVPYRQSGKVVVAVGENERPRLDALATRGRTHGLTIRTLDLDEQRELEPHVTGVAAIHVAETGVIDYLRVAECYADVLRAGGGAIALGCAVERVEPGRGGCSVLTSVGVMRARLVVVCAGLQSDRLASASGMALRDVRIVPFRGVYYRLRGTSAELVRGLVYPVPDPALPFLGVHFTRGLDDTVHAGPSAMLALAREGYARSAFVFRDAAEVVTFPGFWRFARAYARTGALELWQDMVKPAYVAALRRYVPMIQPDDVERSGAGIRAQCLSDRGALLDDFLVRESTRVVHVLNAPSPAATASIAIGRHIAALALDQLE